MPGKSPCVGGWRLTSRYAKSPLKLEDTSAYPRTLLLAENILKQANPAAQVLVDDFVGRLASTMDMKVTRIDVDRQLEEFAPLPEMQDFYKRYNAATAWYVSPPPAFAAWGSSDGLGTRTRTQASDSLRTMRL